MLREIIQPLETWLADLALKTPLEAFVILGSFVEEVLAPIPSPFVMALAGSIAFEQKQPLTALFLISLLGVVGKVAGASVLYLVSDTLEDIVLKRLGRFFGVSHEDVQAIGKKFSGGWKDDVTLTFIRALPIMPSAPVSIACGVIKLPWRTFLIGTAVGTFIRNLFYLYVGYAGLSQSKDLLAGLTNIEDLVQWLILLAVALLIAWAYWQRTKKK